MSAAQGKLRHILIILALLVMMAIAGAAGEDIEDDIYEGNTDDKSYAPRGGGKKAKAKAKAKTKTKTKTAEKTAETHYLPNIPLGDEEIVFDSDTVMAKPKEKINLNCGLKGSKEEPRHCIWEKDDTDSYQVADVYSGVYSRMGRPKKSKLNQCGIVIKKATTEDSGVWKCIVFISGHALMAKKTLIISVKDEL